MCDCEGCYEFTQRPGNVLQIETDASSTYRVTVKITRFKQLIHTLNNAVQKLFL